LSSLNAKYLLPKRHLGSLQYLLENNCFHEDAIESIQSIISVLEVQKLTKKKKEIPVKNIYHVDRKLLTYLGKRQLLLIMKKRMKKERKKKDKMKKDRMKKNIAVMVVIVLIVLNLTFNRSL